MPQFSIAAFITFCATLFLGIFVFFYNRKSIINRIFCVYSFSIAEWSFFTAIHALTDSYKLSLFSAKIMHLGVPLIPVLFVRFCLAISNSYEKYRHELRAGYFLSIFFIITSFATPLIVSNVRPKLGYNYFMDGGPLYLLLIIFFSFYSLLGLHILLKTYLATSGNRRNQLKYLFWGSLLGYSFGTSAFMPVYNITTFPYPFGGYAITIYVCITAYTIIKYRLMDINIAITRGAIFATVYTLVLGIPFGVGYRMLGQGPWIIPTSLMVVLATTGPYLYLFL